MGSNKLREVVPNVLEMQLEGRIELPDAVAVIVEAGVVVAENGSARVGQQVGSTLQQTLLMQQCAVPTGHIDDVGDVGVPDGTPGCDVFRAQDSE